MSAWRALLAGLLLATVALGGAVAQPYPSRHITLIVPYASGGSVDAVARMVAQRLGERLGQSVIIDNVAGAGGVIGTQKAANAAPNGYNLLLSVESTMAIAKLVSPSIVHYDSQKDFVPITLIGTSPLVLVGKNSLPARDIAELMTMLRAEPGKLSYASSGIGTSLHVAGEMINQQGRVAMTHVPYKVGAQIVTDLVGNHVDLALLPLVMALQNVRTGNIKAFGVTEPTRSPAAPEIPSLTDYPDLKGVDMTVWFGTFAPAKTDPAIVARLHEATLACLQEPDLKAKLGDMGLRLVGSGPTAFAAFLGAEIEKFAAVVRAADIKAE